MRIVKRGVVMTSTSGECLYRFECSCGTVAEGAFDELVKPHEIDTDRLYATCPVCGMGHLLRHGTVPIWFNLSLVHRATEET